MKLSALHAITATASLLLPWSVSAQMQNERLPECLLACHSTPPNPCNLGFYTTVALRTPPKPYFSPDGDGKMFSVGDPAIDYTTLQVNISAAGALSMFIGGKLSTPEDNFRVGLYTTLEDVKWYWLKGASRCRSPANAYDGYAKVYKVEAILPNAQEF